MAKKNKPRRTREQAPKAPKPIFASPFKELKKMIREHSAAQTSKSRPPATPAPIPPAIEDTPEPLDDAALLQQALLGVKPLPGSRPHRIPLNPAIKREIVSEDAEVMAQLSDLVSGTGRFDITETDEYVEGARVGLDPRLLSQLRRGEFAMQSHIDLHGMIRTDAKEALSRFVLDSVQKGLRAVLVVHGRGLGSPGGHPVLKHAVVTWLSQRALSGYVLGFATARPADGGAGAMYVLLRRERRRAPFEVLHGAKRRD